MRVLLLVGVLALLVPARAVAQSPAPAQSPAVAPQEPSGPGAPEAERHNLVGVVVSVDAEKSTLTFTDPKGQTLTWKVEGKATARLKSLKPGQKIKIGYSVDDKGAPQAAISIRFVGKGKKSEAT
jgi:hypothetical protein